MHPRTKLEDLDLGGIMTDRRKAVANSLHTITSDELKELAVKIWPIEGQAWGDAFRAFIKEHAGSTFYQATTNDNISIVYCREKEKGIWYMPGLGVGIMQAAGLKAMQEIVDSI